MTIVSSLPPIVVIILVIVTIILIFFRRSRESRTRLAGAEQDLWPGHYDAAARVLHVSMPTLGKHDDHSAN